MLGFRALLSCKVRSKNSELRSTKLPAVGKGRGIGVRAVGLSFRENHPSESQGRY